MAKPCTEVSVLTQPNGALDMLYLPGGKLSVTCPHCGKKQTHMLWNQKIYGMVSGERAHNEISRLCIGCEGEFSFKFKMTITIEPILPKPKPVKDKANGP